MKDTENKVPDVKSCAHCAAPPKVERASSDKCWIAIIRHKPFCIWVSWLNDHEQIIIERGFAAWNARADLVSSAPAPPSNVSLPLSVDDGVQRGRNAAYYIFDADNNKVGEVYIPELGGWLVSRANAAAAPPITEISDNPTLEEAEAYLRANGINPKDVVNEFIQRLLRENLELKQRLAAAPSVTVVPPSSDAAVVAASPRLLTAEALEAVTDYFWSADSPVLSEGEVQELVESALKEIKANTIDEGTLRWAANWILDSLKGETNERVVEFARNMAMTLRAAALPAAAPTAPSAQPVECFCGTELEAGLCPNGHDPIKPEALVDAVQDRMDRVVEAAVAWHESGQEGEGWFEAGERLTQAIESLLELRSPAMPRRWCSVHNREEFKYESLEHELHASTPSTEMISRADAIRLAQSYLWGSVTDSEVSEQTGKYAARRMMALMAALRVLPSVRQPQRFTAPSAEAGEPK